MHILIFKKQTKKRLFIKSTFACFISHCPNHLPPEPSSQKTLRTPTPQKQTNKQPNKTKTKNKHHAIFILSLVSYARHSHSHHESCNDHHFSCQHTTSPPPPRTPPPPWARATPPPQRQPPPSPLPPTLPAPLPPPPCPSVSRGGGPRGTSCLMWGKFARLSWGRGSGPVSQLHYSSRLLARVHVMTPPEGAGKVIFYWICPADRDQGLGDS